MAITDLTLSVGDVAIYGMGTSVSLSGTGIKNIETNNPSAPKIDLRFGSIYHIWSGGTTYVDIGDTVMFRNDQVRYRVLADDYPYTIISARLVTKEQLPP